MKPEKQVQYGIRLPVSFLKRLDKLAEAISTPGMRVTRAHALRVAAFRGAEQLEAEATKRK